MIKKIIFDLDDTLIDFDEKLQRSIKMNDNKITKEEQKALMKVLLTYEERHDKYTYKDMYEEINQVLTNKMTMSEFLTILNNCKKLVPKPKNKELINTLKYLSSKYELVVLTNFFTEIQEARLENYGILKYFSSVFGGDLEKCKPHFRSYAIACGSTSFNECLMIGDDLELDVKMPITLGMKAIWYNKANKTSKYQSIASLQELKELL